jgi:hypothetical protein
MECYEYEWLGCIPLCADLEIQDVEGDSFTIYINGKIKLIQDNLTIEGKWFEENAINSIVIKVEGEIVKRLKFKTITKLETLCPELLPEDCDNNWVNEWVECGWVN